MFTNDTQPTITAATLHEQLRELEAERALARANGLGANALYMADLDAGVAHTRAAYVGAAVTEIAVLRAALDAPLLG
jgi:hypothetical protein